MESGRRYYDAPVPAPTVVILAAGEGTRMRSALPKVLHPLCGRPLIAWPVAAAQEAGAGRVVVVDNPKRRLEDQLPEGVELAIQAEPRGTGDAVAAAVAHIGDETVVVLNGDVPLITAAAIARLIEAHEQAGAAATMATMELDEPGAYGRVVRDTDGSVLRVVEAKEPGDATPEELEIREVNTGVYAFDGGALKRALAQLGSDNAQGELYLPDVLPILNDEGLTVAAHLVADAAITLGAQGDTEAGQDGAPRRERGADRDRRPSQEAPRGRSGHSDARRGSGAVAARARVHPGVAGSSSVLRFARPSCAACAGRMRSSRNDACTCVSVRTSGTRSACRSQTRPIGQFPCRPSW